MALQRHAEVRLDGIPSCRGLITRLAFDRAKNKGLDIAPLLQPLGLALEEIGDGAASISVKTQIRSLNQIAELLDDPLLGFHVAKEMDPRATGLLYYAAASSETLGHALLRTMRYSSIANEGIILSVQTGDTVRVRFDYAGVFRLGDRHQLEAWIAALICICRTLTRRELRPAHIKIVHERIQESRELDAFFGRTIEFGADADEVIFAGDVAKLSVASFDPYLNELLIKYCEEALGHAKPPSPHFRHSVENAIAILLPHGQATITNVAKRLGITPRTLRRRLSAEATSFARILRDLRFALAKGYLAEKHLPISRIAWLLGYTEVSTFSHAFTRWSGRAPRAIRTAA